MPNGSTHAKATFLCCLSTASLMLASHYAVVDVLSTGIGFVLGIKVSPDKDLNSAFPRSDPSGWIDWIYWRPYALLFKHRSVWSHFPLIATAIRFAYLLLPILVVISCSGIEVDNYQRALTWMFLGYLSSDSLHTLMDIFFTLLVRK